jgi:DNA repair protein RadD
LLLDYADNVYSHFEDGDIYNPTIRASTGITNGKGIKAICPSCSYENRFSCRPEYEDNPIDENGYCIDVFGSRIETDYGPMPAHFGRRCFGFTPSITDRGKLDRCDYYWSSKVCEACEEKNDISARYCRSCKAELVDPGEKLIGEFRAHKRDPHLPQCDVVLSMTCKQSVSQAGNPTLRVDWVTPYRQFSVYFLPESEKPLHKSAYDKFMLHTDSGNAKPMTISYRKSDSKFFVILDYNQPEDEEPVMGKVA